MNYFKRIVSLSLLGYLLIGIPTSILADNVAERETDSPLATKIANSYLKSFPTNVQSVENRQKKKRRKKKVKHTPPKLDKFTARRVVLNHLLAKSNTLSLLQAQEPILNTYAWDDLRLFYGTTSHPGYHLMSCINRTMTTLGEGILATMLVTPTNYIPELHKRQNIIKTICAHPEIVDKLQECLRAYKKAEEGFLALWNESDLLYNKTYSDYFHRKFYFKNKNANRSATKLGLRKFLLCDMLGVGLRLTYPLLFIGAPSTAFPIYNIYYMATVNSTVNTSFVVMQNLGYGWNVYTGIKNYQDCKSALHYLALRMSALQSFIIAGEALSQCVASLPVLEEVYAERLASLRLLLNQVNEDTAFGKFIHRLQTLPLKSWSYFFGNAGKLLASYQVFLSHKDQFVEAFYDVGQLDVFLSIAQLMQEAQVYSEHAYVFTQFLDRSQKNKPYIKLVDMWNPFIDAQKAVPNTLTMDASKGMHTMILTGPNAGGKSTFLTGVTLSLLLSQTFGIAPCKKATITPFNKLNTYINIADDVAAGKSRFVAEVERAQKHSQVLKTLPQKAFSFSIMDELFSGTNPREGEAAAYSMMEYMGKYDNALNIIATHFPKVMLLEKNVPGFVNYKVFITYEGTPKKLHYTYKVVPGQSNQTIAIDILEEQGYNTKMLQRARDILAHPEKYR